LTQSTAHTVEPLILRRCSVVDEGIVYDTRLDAVQQIQEEHRIGQAWVLETSHGRRLAALLDGVIGPSDHFLVSDPFTVLGDRRERLIDRDSHELPDETENQGFCTVDDIGSLDADQVHTVCLTEIDGVIGIFDSFESGQLLAFLWLGHSPPNDRSWNNLVESLQQDMTILYVSFIFLANPP
jgi:hypothetical protein